MIKLMLRSDYSLWPDTQHQAYFCTRLTQWHNCVVSPVHNHYWEHQQHAVTTTAIITQHLCRSSSIFYCVKNELALCVWRPLCRVSTSVSVYAFLVSISVCTTAHIRQFSTWRRQGVFSRQTGLQTSITETAAVVLRKEVKKRRASES